MVKAKNNVSFLFLKRLPADEYAFFISKIDRSCMKAKEDDTGRKSVFVFGSIVTLIFIEVDDAIYQVITTAVDGIIFYQLSKDAPPEQLLAAIESLSGQQTSE